MPTLVPLALISAGLRQDSAAVLKYNLVTFVYRLHLLSSCGSIKMSDNIEFPLFDCDIYDVPTQHDG